VNEYVSIEAEPVGGAQDSWYLEKKKLWRNWKKNL